MPYIVATKAIEVFNQLQDRFQLAKTSRAKDKRIVVFAILQDGSQIQVETFAYSGTEIIIVQGFDSDNNFVEAIMHYSTFQFKMFIVDRDPKKKQKEIKFGF